VQKGDIILVPFPFTDLSGSKKRPAVVLTSGNLDVTVSFISTQIHWKESTDMVLEPNIMNGLKMASLLRVSKIATIDKTLVIGKLGSINSNDINELNKKLVILLDIKIK